MCWGDQNTQSQGAGKDWLPEKKTYYGGRLSIDRRYNRQISVVNDKKIIYLNIFSMKNLIVFFFKSVGKYLFSWLIVFKN